MVQQLVSVPPGDEVYEIMDALTIIPIKNMIVGQIQRQ